MALIATTALNLFNTLMNDASAMRDFFEQKLEFEEVFYFADDSPEIDTPKGLLRSEPTFANLKRGSDSVAETKCNKPESYAV